jgi:hypothetical protein
MRQYHNQKTAAECPVQSLKQNTSRTKDSRREKAKKETSQREQKKKGRQKGRKKQTKERGDRKK